MNLIKYKERILIFCLVVLLVPFNLAMGQAESEKEIDLNVVVYWFFGGLAVVFLVLFILKRLSLIRIERTAIMGLLAGSLFLVIVLFVFSTYQITQNLKNDKLRSVKNSLNAIAASQANHIRHLLRTHKDKINFINMNKGFVGLLETFVDDPKYGSLYDKVLDRLNKSLHEEFDEIFILDKNGQVVISTDERKIGQDRSNNDYFVNSKKNFYIKDAYEAGTTGESSMAVSAPIISENANEFFGVLVVRIKMDNLNKTILSEDSMVGTTESYLVNKDRLAITSLKFEESAFLKTKINEINIKHCFKDKYSPGEHAAHKEATVFQNYKGVDVIGAHVYIPEMQWCLLVERDEEEVMAAINKDISRIWYFTIGIISLIILIGIVFNFLLTRSLKREVETKTAELSIALVSTKKDQKELEKQRLATLNILEDVSDSKGELEKLNQKLEARGKELSALKALSDDLTSVLDVEEVVVIANSYFDKFIDFSTINYLIVNPTQDGSIIYNTYSKEAVSEKYVKESKSHLANFLSLQKDTNFKAAVKIIKNIEPKYYGVGLDNAKKSKPVGYEYYYLSISEKHLGVIQVVHTEKQKINKDELSLLRAIVTTLSLSIDRLQTLTLAQHSKTASLVESLTDGVIMFNDKEEIVLMNPAFSAYTGFSREYFSMIDLYKLLSRYDIQKMVKKALNKGKTSHINEVALVHHFYEMFITPVRDNKEQIVGGAIIFHDITFLKEIDRMKTEFVAVASHQLRTPLTAIKLFTDMMLRGETGKINKEQKEYLENVNESTERMVRLVNDLLNVTRIESGRLRVEPQEIEIKNLLKNIIAETKPLAANRQQKIIFKDNNVSIPKVKLDQNLVRQVFHNLIINAIRYSPEKTGNISIILSQDNKKTFTVAVHDNGIGIPKKAQKRIFEKFYRADNAIKSITEGTGLGLYVSKMIVESSGGKIWFESAKGKGSSFYVCMPIKGMEKKEGERGLAIS